jgi:hypothetical protein
MAKKSWAEKLKTKNDLPKIVKLDKEAAKRWSGDTMYIPCPKEVYEVMKKVPKGKFATVATIREYFAKKHKTAISCPLTTGIFTWIAANASEELHDDVPYWRTLKGSGELNDKYPGGAEKQRKLLEKEGHKIVTKGKKLIVQDLEKKLAKL